MINPEWISPGAVARLFKVAGEPHTLWNGARAIAVQRKSYEMEFREASRVPQMCSNLKVTEIDPQAWMILTLSTAKKAQQATVQMSRSSSPVIFAIRCGTCLWRQGLPGFSATGINVVARIPLRGL